MASFPTVPFITFLLVIISYTPQKEPANLRVMSYNIRAGQESDIDRIAKVIEDQNPDIVALQEVDVHWSGRSNYKDQARYLGKALNMYHFFGEIYALSPAEGLNNVRRYGLAFLSKYPFRHQKNHRLMRLTSQNGENETDKEPQKLPGFPQITVEVAGREVHLFNTHLDYRSDPQLREIQVNDMLRIIHDIKSPVILFGDFNAEPADPEISRLFEALDDVWKNKREEGLTYPADRPAKRIDYILHSDHFDVRDAFVVRTPASDHRPVVADLVLN